MNGSRLSALRCEEKTWETRMSTVGAYGLGDTLNAPTAGSQ